MILKITAIADDKLGSHDAKRIEGTRIDNGEPWSKKFFANDKELRTQLDDFGVGDCVKIKLKQNEKNKRFWDIVRFDRPTEEEVNAVKDAGKSGTPSSSYSKGGGGGKSSNGLTKEEWAEKDRKAKIGMSIHNSVAAAAQICKTGTSAEALVEYAKKLLPYLLREEVPVDVLVKIDKPDFVGDKSDPLEPPVD